MPHFADPPLHSWLPHRPPMLLLESVPEAGSQGGTALARVDPAAWYADASGAMPAWIGLELMAQAIAACRGRHLAEAGGAPRGGYLVGARGYRSTVPAFPPGALLEIRVELELEDPSGLRGFSCAIRHGRETVATGILRIMEQP